MTTQGAGGGRGKFGGKIGAGVSSFSFENSCLSGTVFRL